MKTEGTWGWTIFWAGSSARVKAWAPSSAMVVASDPSALPSAVSAAWISAAEVAEAIAPRAAVKPAVKEARKGSWVIWLIRLSRLAVAWLRATGSVGF